MKAELKTPPPLATTTTLSALHERFVALHWGAWQQQQHQQEAEECNNSVLLLSGSGTMRSACMIVRRHMVSYSIHVHIAAQSLACAASAGCSRLTILSKSVGRFSSIAWNLAHTYGTACALPLQSNGPSQHKYVTGQIFIATELIRRIRTESVWGAAPT